MSSSLFQSSKRDGQDNESRCLKQKQNAHDYLNRKVELEVLFPHSPVENLGSLRVATTSTPLPR